ncbi:MAG TPA: heparin lyase I family protein [Nocardioidaceae bacterium]|nr:heparin lyase I family protein [Nocardioidaceae bacterium]
MANLPANPGEALWLGGDSGKYHANVGIGGPGGDLDHTDYSQSTIEDGFTLADYFYLDSNGDCVFKQYVENGRTSTNTKYSRTELRELQPNGTDKAAWNSGSGTFSDEAISKIDHVPSAKPWVVFFQVHDADSDFFRVQTEDGAIVCRRTPPGGSEIRTVLRSSYTAGAWIAWKWQFDSGRLRIWLDGTVVLDVTGMSKTGCYAKLGCYNQVNNRSDGGSAPTGEYCQVTVQRGSLKRVRPGYPASTTPVFTGGTDAGGGPGGGAGNDTQPPTVPGSLIGGRGNTRATLAWSASTDNVGVDHYNIYRYSASGSSGGDGTISTLGRSTGGATSSATSSSADKLVASPAVASAGGTLTSGHFRAWLSASGSTTAKMVVYANSGSSPGALLATSDQLTITSTTPDSTRDFVFSGANQITITAAATYWVGVTWADPGTPSITYDRGDVTAQRVERSDITYGTPPNPFGTATGTFTGPIEAWCDVVSGSGAGTGGGGTTSHFGKQTSGASSSASSADKTAVSSATASASGTLTAGHARVSLSGSGSATTKCVLYANSGGAPGARLATSDPVTITNTSVATIDYVFSGAAQVAVTSGTTYWVGLAWQDPGSVSVNIFRDATASGRQEAAAYAPDPFGTPSALTGPIDVYLDTTSGTGTGTAGGFVLLTTVDDAVLTYTDTGLTNGTTYTYAVSAEDAAGNESALSNQVTIIPGTPDSDAPTVPTNLAAVAGDRRVTLTWDPSTDVDNGTPLPPDDGGGVGTPGVPIGETTEFFEGFEAGNFDQWNSVQVHSGSESYALTIVADGTDHPDAMRCEVRDGDTAVGSHERAEVSGFGKATWSNGAERWYEFDFKLGTLPTIGASDWMIIFQWHQVNDPGAPALALSIHNDGKVYFEREPDSDFEFIPVWTPVVGTWHHVVVHVKWSPNSSIGFIECHVDGVEKVAKVNKKTMYSADTSDYYIKCGTYRRVNVSGTSVVYHDNIRISSPPEVTPGGDTGQTPTTPPAPSGVLKYRVYRDSSLAAEVPSNASTATALVDVGLTNGTTYSYTVSAVDVTLNESDQSAAVTATPTAESLTGAPLLPGRLSGGSVEVAIAWGANLAADESTWTWSDITADVRQHPGISTSLGRNDESSTSNPAELTLVLDNSSGDYSLGSASAHYPYVRRNTPVRVRINPGDGNGGRIVVLAFANGFTPGWDTLKGNLPVVTLSASGTLRRLSQGDAPLKSAYRRVMEAAPTVKAYWPLEEGKDSTFAYPVKGGSVFTYTGGSPGWASDSSFDCSSPLPTLSDAYGQADVTAYPNTGSSQVRLLLSVPESGLTSGTVFMHIEMTGTIHRWDITYEIINGVECLGLYRYDAPAIPGTFNSSDVIAFPVNGNPGRLSLEWRQSGPDIVWTLSFTPATATGATTSLYVQRTLPGRTAGIVSHFELNPHNANIGATIGHITVENAITSAFADSDALIAHSGETNTSSDGRLARLCAENGVKLQRYTGTPADVTALDQMGPQLVGPLLNLLHECEVSNQGQLWDGRGAGLQYTTGARRTLGTVKLTVDASAEQLAGDFAPVDDDQRDRNKVTVTRLHGASYTYEDVSGAKGTSKIGIYDDAVTVNCFADDSTVDFATWFVRLGTVEGYRYPSVSVDLAASPSLAAAVLDIIPGERIQVTNLNTTLAGFPDATVDLIVEGIAHEITTRSWTATFRCSPYGPWGSGGVSGVTNAAGGLAAATPRPVGTLAGTVTTPGAPVSGALAATTPRPSGALAGTAGSGTLSDLTSQSFTDSGSLAGNYHFYGGGLPSSGAGLVVHLHGDAAYEYLNPTDNYCLAGNRGLIAVAKAKGYALLVPKAPDTTGTVTWWEAGARNAQWLSELLANIYSTKGINTSKVWLVGYSGGAQQITQYFVPLYGKAKIAGGGALILGGGAAAVSTPSGWDSTFKAAFPMHWITGGQDDGTYADDGYDALTDANAGKTYYAGQGFTTTISTPPGIDHEIDGMFGPALDDLLPTLSGYSPPSRTPGSTRPTLVTSYKVTATGTGTTTTSSFTPAAGEVIVVKAWNADFDSPNVTTVTGGSLTYASKIHTQATNKSEAWIFVAEVGATSPGAMTVAATWSGTSGQHGIIVERWSSGLVKGVPAESSPVMGSGAPSATITPENANSVLTWLDVDWNVSSGTATYRSGATETQQSSTSNVRAYAAYQNSTGTSAQTVGLSAPTGQAWTLGAIELLPAH